MRIDRRNFYELRHVIDFKRPYITMLVDVFADYTQALKEAQRLRKISPGTYLIKRIITEIIYVSKHKKE